jgi:hypothetical protein
MGGFELIRLVLQEKLNRLSAFGKQARDQIIQGRQPFRQRPLRDQPKHTEGPLRAQTMILVIC